MKKRVFALFTAMFLLCGMLAGCGPTGSSSTTTDGSDDGAKDTLIVAIPESPTYMDPMVQASIGTYRVTTQMFDRLVMMDNDMNLVPGLAESWEVIDDTTTVFHLRQGVKFHNGEEMTSEDVKYSLERCIANPGVNYNYLIIESITCDDDYTVTIKTSAPFNALLYRLSLDAASIICKSADTSAEEFNKNPVGTGPFKFVSWELGGDVVLEAFEDYWGGAPAVKRVIFRTIPEALNRTIGLETGEVDLAYDLGITDLESLADNASVTTLTSPSTTVWYVGMNVQKAPFDNEKVRQAVAYALDPQGYIDLVFSGEATPANYTMLPPSVDGYVSDCSDYSCNVEKAKELLALLIDRQGLSMTNGEIEAFLWEELHSPQYLQTLFYSLRKTLRGIGFEDLLIRTRNHTSIDVSKLHCDLYEFLKGSADAVNSYAGEYMNNYSWAELTNARLYNGPFSDFVLAAQARPRR